MATCRPDRATGTRAGLSVQEETCWGQLAEESDPAVDMEAIGVEFVSEDLANQINSIESQLIRADRMRSPTQQGNRRPGGNITGELQPHGCWPLFLKHALGGSIETSGSYPYVHLLRGDVDLPEGLTIEKKIGFPSGLNKYHRFLGCKANEFYISIPQEGIVQARVGVIAKIEELLDDPMDAAATYPSDNEPFNSFQGAILLDRDGSGSRVLVATLTQLDMTINNSIDPDQFAIDGDSARADVPEDLRIINGNLTAFFTRDNYDLYEAFLNNTSLSMQFTLTRGLFSWSFTIPQFKVRGDVTPKVSGRGPISLPIQWEAHRDDDLGTDIEVAITNADPAIQTNA